ncbi:DUF1622 domain-containing protein [Chloroflexi bacterium TSY]|nr:DUF1622 domain-containing protein [Chloroflexi bacterium TSY]
MNDLQELVRILGYAIEFLGVFVIVAGSVVATARFLYMISRSGPSTAYNDFRSVFGHAIILGLDFLIAGDIIRTVVVSHTIESVMVLGIIVVIRAFLSITLEMGISGRLPWKTTPKLNDSSLVATTWPDELQRSILREL